MSEVDVLVVVSCIALFLSIATTLLIYIVLGKRIASSIKELKVVWREIEALRIARDAQFDQISGLYRGIDKLVSGVADLGKKEVKKEGKKNAKVKR